MSVHCTFGRLSFSTVFIATVKIKWQNEGDVLHASPGSPACSSLSFLSSSFLFYVLLHLVLAFIPSPPILSFSLLQESKELYLRFHFTRESEARQSAISWETLETRYGGLGFLKHGYFLFLLPVGCCRCYPRVPRDSLLNIILP